MSKALITESNLTDIAGAIRAKLGVETTYRPGDMAAAIGSIETPNLEALTVTQNGSYSPSTGKNGFSGATVNVPNSYAAADEGKVVSSGALVAQTARASAITSNGTYDTTANNSVTVNVSGGGGGLPAGVSMGTGVPDPSSGSDGDIYLRQYDLTLPSGAKFVEYLESTGTQYIDAGMQGDDTTSYYVRFKTPETGTKNGVFGSQYNNTSRLFGVNRSSDGNVYINCGSSGNTLTELLSNLPYDSIVTCERFLDAVYINGEFRARQAPSHFASTCNILVFGYGSQYNDKYPGKARIYRLVLMTETTVVRDYIPALDENGVACMFEAISGEFVYNDGTGDFLAGNEATPYPFWYEYRKQNDTWMLKGWSIM